MTARMRRLMSDYEQVKKDFAGHKYIVVTPIGTEPPEQYHVTYFVNGIYLLPDGKIETLGRHEVEITLHADYPRYKPICRILTPIWHPNFRDGQICIGDIWGAGESLTDIIINIGDMIQYKSWNSSSPLSADAAQWAIENKHLFPVGNLNLYISDYASATQPLSSLSGISLASVTEESGGASYTFYMTSPNIGSGSFAATFTLPSGETRGVAKSYRVIEPIRRLVCSEIDPEYSCVYNPSRLVYGHPARLKVGVNGNFSPSDVEWSIVSGPGTVVRGEDDFGSADWTATVTATAESGEVVVEARFNEDAIQPRFVLPIVQMRTIPIEAYIVCASNGVGATTQAAIEEKIWNANIIWKQAGVQFQLNSVAMEMPFPQYFVLSERVIVTNSAGVVELGKSASCDVYDLMARAPTNNVIRTFWVGSITNGTPIAFTMQKHKSVFASQLSSGRAFAHELGHAIGLADIYVKRKIKGGVVVLPYAGYPVSKDFFDDKICDWGAESACGFYQMSDNLGAIIPSLLMHGEDVSSESEVADLPSGSVLGFGKDVRSVFATTNVVVGVNGITE